MVWLVAVNGLGIDGSVDRNKWPERMIELELRIIGGGIAGGVRMGTFRVVNRITELLHGRLHD